MVLTRTPEKIAPEVVGMMKTLRANEDWFCLAVLTRMPEKIVAEVIGTMKTTKDYPQGQLDRNQEQQESLLQTFKMFKVPS